MSGDTALILMCLFNIWANQEDGWWSITLHGFGMVYAGFAIFEAVMYFVK